MTAQSPEGEKLQKMAAARGVTLDDTALGRFALYGKLLLDWNEKLNLTAITDPTDIVVRHFVDSLSILSLISLPEGASLIDVGTGAGFPGLALKIARPDLQVTLLDSTQKKLTALGDIAEKLQLPVTLLHARAEEAGHDPALREQFDAATARAVAQLRVLSEYCLPFVRPDGVFLAMKSADVRTELSEAKGAIRVLGGVLAGRHDYTLPDAGERCILEVKKVSPTPAPYPRPSAKIARKPLG